MKYFNRKALNEREQKLLIIGGIIFICALIYYFIWEPLEASNERLTNQITQQQQLLTWIQQQQVEIDRLSVNARTRSAEENSQPVFTTVENNLTDAGLYTASTQLSSANVNNVTIQSDDINFDEFIAWLTQLGEQHNIIAVQGNMQRIEGEPGEARINIMLEAS